MGWVVWMLEVLGDSMQDGLQEIIEDHCKRCSADPCTGVVYTINFFTLLVYGSNLDFSHNVVRCDL